MTKGGKRFNHWMELNGRPYYVGMKRLPTSTKVTIKDCNKHMLKYTYVRDERGIWALIESAEMLGRAQPVDKVYGAMIIFLMEPEVEVVDDTGAKVFLAMDLSRFEGNIGTMRKKDR